MQRGHVRAQLGDTYCLPWLSHWSPCQVMLQLLDETAAEKRIVIKSVQNREKRRKSYLFDVVAGFGACLDEHNIQLFGLLFAILRKDLPLILQVGFIAYQHDDDVVSTLGSDIVNPFGSLVE